METKFNLTDPLSFDVIRTGILALAMKHRSFSVMDDGWVATDGARFDRTSLSEITRNGIECFFSIRVESIELTPWEGNVTVCWAEKFVSAERAKRLLRRIVRLGVENISHIPYDQLEVWEDLCTVLDWVKPHQN